MTTNPNTPEFETVENILDKHAEYYIRQTMKFFQENGESPALSKNNEGDLVAKRSLKQSMRLIFSQVELGHFLNCGDICMCGYDSRKQRLDQALTKYFGEE